MYRNNEVFNNVVINYTITKPNAFEVYVDDKVYVDKSIEYLISDISYVLHMVDKGIKYISIYSRLQYE